MVLGKGRESGEVKKVSPFVFFSAEKSFDKRNSPCDLPDN